MTDGVLGNLVEAIGSLRGAFRFTNRARAPGGMSHRSSVPCKLLDPIRRVSPGGLVADAAGGSGEDSYLVDSASSHMLVSKIKPCMSKFKQILTVKLRMAH